MDVKNLIDYLGQLKTYMKNISEPVNFITEPVDEIIKRLKILEETEALISSEILNDKSYATLVWLRREMKKLNQKYFPKQEPIKKTVILEIEATNKENMESKIESLKSMFEVHNEFNWGKTKIIEIKEGD